MPIITKSLASEIKASIVGGPKGTLYSVSDFCHFHNSEVVTKTLFRLEKSGLLIRLAKGIYLYPETNRFGIAYPPLNVIAKYIAERDKVEIRATGNTALNQLGLSTQVPMNAVFITSGSARTIPVGKRKIIFKRSVAKNFVFKGKIIPMIILALKELGPTNIDSDIESKLQEIIKNNCEPLTVYDDLELAPSWIKKTLLPIIKLTYEHLA